jgi:hypothetical protein
MSNELYPGRSVITCEMLAAWKARNHARRYRSSTYVPDLYALLALRRVWHALRAAR